MAFPKFLKIFVNSQLAHNVTATGEFVGGDVNDLHIIEFLSRALHFSYKAYPSDNRPSITRAFLVGGFALDEGFYSFATYPHGTTEITFSIAKPEYAIETLASLKPFQLSVWLSLLLCILFISLMHFFIFRRRVPFLSVLFHMVVAFFGNHRDWRPKLFSQTVMVLTCSMGIMCLTLSYGSVLLSCLTVPYQDKGITDFGELYEAIKAGKATAKMFDTAGTDNILIRSKDEKLKFIGEHIRQNKVNVNRYLEVIKSDVAIIAVRDELESMAGGDRYFISQDSVFLQFFCMFDWTAVATGEKFCCMDQVNEVIHYIWSSGLNQKVNADKRFRVMLKYLFKFEKLYPLVQYPVRPLTLSSLTGAFYFLITGQVLALICFSCEILIHHYS